MIERGGNRLVGRRTRRPEFGRAGHRERLECEAVADEPAERRGVAGPGRAGRKRVGCVGEAIHRALEDDRLVLRGQCGVGLQEHRIAEVLALAGQDRAG